MGTKVKGARRREPATAPATTCAYRGTSLLLIWRLSDERVSGVVAWAGGVTWLVACLELRAHMLTASAFSTDCPLSCVESKV